MPTREECVEAAARFRTKDKYAVEGSDENLIAAIHLVNRHGVNPEDAIARSSQSGNDHGIDAWHYLESQQTLYIYQSKLAESKPVVLKGLSDLLEAANWLFKVIGTGELDRVPTGNPSLYNLYLLLSTVRTEIRVINLRLLSPINRNLLEDSKEFYDFETQFSSCELNTFVNNHLQAKLTFDFSEYDLVPGTPPPSRVYKIPVIPETRLEIKKGMHLDLAYVPLHSLVELYRRRGNILFDKNVRLSLIDVRGAKERLKNPMTATLDQITRGHMEPKLFTFYHVGITIAASRSLPGDVHSLDLESPSVINGCQTITIATAYLSKLEDQKDRTAIERFNQIKVVAKVVIGVSSDETREITNANNRQNPIENWQLFANEPIHIAIETLLKDAGVLYERQKGKYDTLKNCDTQRQYPNTNGTFLKVEDLAQVIALSKGDLESAAKPSKIFLTKSSHDKIFDRSVLSSADDLIFLVNIFKALKRALTNYLKKPAQVNSNAQAVFGNTMVRMHCYRLALMHFYRTGNRKIDRGLYSTKLFKIANPRLVDEAEIFYLKVITRTRDWYAEASNKFAIKVSQKNLNAYFLTLAIDIGLDAVEDRLPFAA